MELQADPENSTIELIHEVCAGRQNTFPRAGPRASKGSQGRVERLIQSIEKKSKTILADVEKQYNTTIPNNHAILDWVVRHSAWTLDFCHQGSKDGQTAYERQHLKRYTSALVPFGETVQWREPGPQRQYKLRSMWGKGIYLGHSYRDNAHIIGTRDGWLSCRTVRRLIAENQADVQLLLAFNTRIQTREDNPTRRMEREHQRQETWGG